MRIQGVPTLNSSPNPTAKQRRDAAWRVLAARMCGGFDNSVCQGDDTDYAREESEQKEWLSKRNINKQEL